MWICRARSRRCGTPSRFRVRWCSPIWWYLQSCRLSSWPARQRGGRSPSPLRNSCSHGSWHHSNRKWSHCLILPSWNPSKDKRHRGWHCKSEAHHKDPNQPRCTQSQDSSRNSAFGTSLPQSWHVATFPVNWHESRWGVWPYARSAETVLRLHSWARQYYHAQNLSCPPLDRQYTLLLLMFLSHLFDTWVSACDHSSCVLDGNDGRTHRLLRVEEALLLRLLRRLLSVHSNFKKYLNYQIIALTPPCVSCWAEVLANEKREGRVGVGWGWIIIDDESERVGQCSIQGTAVLAGHWALRSVRAIVASGQQKRLLQPRPLLL